MPGARIQAIVIDAVGTLIEPSPSVSEAYTQAALRQGIALDRVLVKERFRNHFRRDEAHELRGPMATDEGTEWKRWNRIVHAVLPEVPDATRAFAELWDHFARPESWVVFDDAVAALDCWTRAGLAVRIASNFDSRLRGVLAGFPELAAWRDGLVISSEVGYRKPHGRFYEVACERLGVEPPRVLCIGDDLVNDVQGALRAGLQAVLLDRDGQIPLEGDLPVRRVRSLSELAELGGACGTPGVQA